MKTKKQASHFFFKKHFIKFFQHLKKKIYKKTFVRYATSSKIFSSIHLIFFIFTLCLKQKNIVLRVVDIFLRCSNKNLEAIFFFFDIFFFFVKDFFGVCFFFFFAHPHPPRPSRSPPSGNTLFFFTLSSVALDFSSVLNSVCSFSLLSWTPWCWGSCS